MLHTATVEQNVDCASTMAMSIDNHCRCLSKNVQGQNLQCGLATQGMRSEKVEVVATQLKVVVEVVVDTESYMHVKQIPQCKFHS